MKQKLAAAVTTVTMAVVAVVMASATACNVQQPPFGCQVQRLTWAARYNLVEGQTVTGPCANKKGERLGIQIFNDPTNDKNTLVIQPETLAALNGKVPDATGNYAYALSDSYPNIADPNGFCVAPTMSTAEKHVPASGTSPARDIVYKWSNVRVVSKADAPGTQFVGDLDYTEGGCTAKYEVWGNWPSVGCADENGAPSDEICATSSILNSEFKLVCDPTQKRCVPGSRPPSYK